MFIITGRVFDNNKFVGFEGYWNKQTPLGNSIESDELYISKDVAVALCNIGLIRTFISTKSSLIEGTETLGQFSTFGSIVYCNDVFIHSVSTFGKFLEYITACDATPQSLKKGCNLKTIDYSEKENYKLIDDVSFFKDKYDVDLDNDLRMNKKYNDRVLILSDMYSIALFCKSVFKADFVDGVDNGAEIFTMKLKFSEGDIIIKSVSIEGTSFKGYELILPYRDKPIVGYSLNEIIQDLLDDVKKVDGKLVYVKY